MDGAFYREKGAEPSGALFPWTVEAGEIARFRLRLSLNDLGRSFLTTEPAFVSHSFIQRSTPKGAIFIVSLLPSRGDDPFVDRLDESFVDEALPALTEMAQP